MYAGGAGLVAPTVIAAAGVHLNPASPLAADASAGDTSLTVDDLADLDDATGLYASPSVGAGSLLLAYQPQGASIQVVNSASFGAVTDLGSAGAWELVWVDRVVGDTVHLDAALHPDGLQHDYATGGRAQVIRVPAFEDLTVAAGRPRSRPRARPGVDVRPGAARGRQGRAPPEPCRP